MTAVELEGVDLFCGAGGLTTGTEDALAELGLKARLRAVNHWPLAIETHRRNHPQVEHYVQDVTLVDPLTIVPGGYLDFLLASPECTFHSTARGGKPIHDQKRMDPWAVIRWLTVLEVRLLIVENVPEFVNWGPLCRLPRRHEGEHDSNWRAAVSGERCDRPDPKKRGVYFEAWYNAIIGLGYEVQWRNLNAADYGDATTRTRFFLHARKDGRPIVWPEATHTRNPQPTMLGITKKWRAAREVINWERRRPSIFDRKTPLSLNTRLRMAEGFARYAGPLAPLYIALLDIPDGVYKVRGRRQKPFVMGKQASPAYRDVDEPLPTLTTDGSPSLVEPVVSELVAGNRNNNVPRPVDEPLPTATSAPGGGMYLVEVTSEPFILGQHVGGAPRAVEAPMMTIAGAGALALVEPIILPYYRTGVADTVDDPLATVTTKARFGLMQALVVPYGPQADARDVDEPMHTITAKDRLALAAAEPQPFVFQGAPHTPETTGVRPVDEPIYTITTNPRLQVVEPKAFIVPNFGEREGQAPRVHDIDEPAPTATSRGAGNLVEPVVIETDQTGGNGAYVRSVEDPLFTQPTKQNQALAEPVLLQVNHGAEPALIQTNDSKGTDGRVRSVDEPMWTVTTHRNVMLAEPVVEAIRAGSIDRRRLVIIDDQLCMLDIRYGMLENDELARAMGFSNEERTYEFAGNKGEVTKQIGNAVACGCAKAQLLAELGPLPGEQLAEAGS